jgi:hypothetical protein
MAMMIETYKLTCHRCGREVCIPAAEPEARVVAPCPHLCGAVLEIVWRPTEGGETHGD